jgi:hypothetical protein
MAGSTDHFAEFDRKKKLLVGFGERLTRLAADGNDKEAVRILDDFMARFTENKFLLLVVGDFKSGKSRLQPVAEQLGDALPVRLHAGDRLGNGLGRPMLEDGLLKQSSDGRASSSGEPARSPSASKARRYSRSVFGLSLSSPAILRQPVLSRCSRTSSSNVSTSILSTPPPFPSGHGRMERG